MVNEAKPTSSLEQPEDFIGCFKDDGNRALDEHQNGKFTMSECASTCADQGYVYSGSQ